MGVGTFSIAADHLFPPCLQMSWTVTLCPTWFWVSAAATELLEYLVLIASLSTGAPPLSSVHKAVPGIFMDVCVCPLKRHKR